MNNEAKEFFDTDDLVYMPAYLPKDEQDKLIAYMRKGQMKTFDEALLIIEDAADFFECDILEIVIICCIIKDTEVEILGFYTQNQNTIH